jgi:hypothetical protein
VSLEGGARLNAWPQRRVFYEYTGPKQACKKDFNLISMTGPATTKEAINNLMNWRPPTFGTA